MSIAGKRVLVTGSSSGIGRAVALEFAREGAAFVFVNCPAGDEESRAEGVLADIVKAGGQGALLPCDVSDEAAVAKMLDAAQAKVGGIDILVNNAGIGHGDTVEAMAVETWDRVLAVHLRGTFLMTRAVLPQMYARNYGRIINTVSQLAYKGAAGLAAYTAAKGGVLAFTRSLALEIGSRNVRVNCVAPGATVTPILDAVPKEALEAVRAAIPTGDLAQPEMIAPTYTFLAGSGGEHYQGQCLSPNGGDMFL